MVLLILGAVLLGRFVKWLGEQIDQRMDVEASDEHADRATSGDFHMATSGDSLMATDSWFPGMAES